MKWAGIIAGVVLAAVLAPQTGWAADIEGKIQSGGRERSYVVHLPPQAEAGQKLALVVVLHGGGGDAKGANKQTHFAAQADKAGFIAVFPDGTDRPRPLLALIGKAGFFTWNAGGCCTYAMENKTDDVGFIRALVGELERKYAIDSAHVYATGISNGAMMSYRLACEASDIFAAVGIVAGAVLTPCTPGQPVAVIAIHGSDDKNVPVNGGVGEKAFTKTTYPPLKDSISLWVRADGCRQPAQTSQPMKDVQFALYTGCRAGSEVALYMIEGGGHSWPGGERMTRVLDSPSQAMDATDTIWQFFAAHPKR